MQPRRFGIEGQPLDHLPPRLRVEQRDGQVGDGALGVGLLARPAAAAEPMQLGAVAGDPHVTAEQMRVGDRHMQLGPLGVFDREDFGALAIDLNLGRTEKTSDAVVDMHHEVARFEVGSILDAPAARGGGGRTAQGLLADRVEVGLRGDRQPRQREAAGERGAADLHACGRAEFARQQLAGARRVGEQQHRFASLRASAEVGKQALTRLHQQLRMMRLLCAEFGKPRQGCDLQWQGRRLRRRRVAAVELAGRRTRRDARLQRLPRKRVCDILGREKRAGADPVVVEPEHGAARRQQVDELDRRHRGF